MKRYDLVVIGTGTAAQVASARLSAAGRSVAIIDYRPFGGTCALRGCDPKKMLISGAEVVDFARRMHDRGVDGKVRIDWPSLMAFKRSFTDPIPQKQEQRFAARGIDAFHGAARFVGRDVVEVDGTVLTGGHILIATGARPVPLGIPGEEHVATSEQFLELDKLPRRIALIGGGYIAAEFSHIAARAGAQVTILQRAPRLLPQFDPDLVGWLTDGFREIGVTVRTGASVTAVEAVPTGLRVRARAGAMETAVEADLVVHAAGRVPDIAALDLAAAGVAIEKGRLRLNEFLQSVSNPLVYAAGDAAAVGPPLTPVSSHDGKVVAANVLHGNKQRPDYRGVPSIAFTLPPIAKVGTSEAEARSQGIKVRVKAERTAGWYTARRVGESVYGYKTIVEEGTGPRPARPHPWSAPRRSQCRRGDQYLRPRDPAWPHRRPA
jgi:glutathione reductase (NADPH)